MSRNARWRAERIAKLIASLLVGAILVAILARWGGELSAFLRDRDRLEAWLDDLGAWGPLAAAAIVALKSVVIILPGQLLALVNGWLFGFAMGALCTYVGMMFGSAFAMLLARRFGRPLVSRLIPARRLRSVDDLARRRGVSFFGFIFLLPFTPDDLACWAIGLTPLPLSRLMAIAALTRLPSALNSAWLGANAGRLDRTGWVVVGVVTAVVIVGYVLGRERIDAALRRWLDGTEGGGGAGEGGKGAGESGGDAVEGGGGERDD